MTHKNVPYTRASSAHSGSNQKTEHRNEITNSSIKCLILLSHTIKANPSHVRAHKPFKEHNHKGDLETSILGLHFVVSGSHFSSGKLKVNPIDLRKIHNIEMMPYNMRWREFGIFVQLSRDKNLCEFSSFILEVQVYSFLNCTLL
jgi:hypothetical protein